MLAADLPRLAAVPGVRPPHEPKRFAFRKLSRKMRTIARSGKWALGLRSTTSAYRIFKSFGGGFRTALPTSLIFDCCGRLKSLVKNDGARYSVSFELSLRLAADVNA